MTELYWRVADPYPLQSAGFNGLNEFYLHLGDGRLTTTRCRGCEKVYWPPTNFCPQCLAGGFDWVALPNEGRVHAFCVQEAGVPQGFRPPLVFGVVALAGLRIFSLILCSDPKKIAVGETVRFKPIEVTGEPGGERRLLHAFEAIGTDAV
jgi:uncharacterized OB-fold protein